MLLQQDDATDNLIFGWNARPIGVKDFKFNVSVLG